MKFSNDQFGFTYGAASVTRIASDEKKGRVVLGVNTPKSDGLIQIYVTKTGKVTIHAARKVIIVQP